MIMSTEQLERDERTVAVENASYRRGYMLLCYALLVDVMYRGQFRHEAAWDLMAFVVIVGGICTAYQARRKILAHRWAMKAALVASVAFVVSALMAMVRVKWIH
jgi:hypothetical protein